MPTDQADGKSLSVEFPFSQVTSAYVELQKLTGIDGPGNIMNA